MSKRKFKHNVRKNKERDIYIARSVLVDNVSMRKLASKYGLTPVSIRAALHGECRRNNPDAYDRLRHTSTYCSGYNHLVSHPLLKKLRENYSLFVVESNSYTETRE